MSLAISDQEIWSALIKIEKTLQRGYSRMSAIAPGTKFTVGGVEYKILEALG